MKLEFPRVTKTIRLSDYAEEMAPAEIQVWVNMTRANIDRINDLKISDPAIIPWLSEVWGPEEWPVEDVQALYDHCITNDNDPGLWIWLVTNTSRLILEYRAGIKKA
jgi:hypothetical protein